MDHIVSVNTDADEPLDADPLLRQLREQRYGLPQKVRFVGSKYGICIVLVVLLVLPLIVNFGPPWNYSSELEPKAFNAMAKKQEDTEAPKLAVLIILYIYNLIYIFICHCAKPMLEFLIVPQFHSVPILSYQRISYSSRNPTMFEQSCTCAVVLSLGIR